MDALRGNVAEDQGLQRRVSARLPGVFRILLLLLKEVIEGRAQYEHPDMEKSTIVSKRSLEDG